MLKQEFKNAMDENKEFYYLKEFYNSIDIASIYGIERMEIKHSNFLKWFFDPKTYSNEIKYLPIRELLKLLKKNNDEYYDYLDLMDFSDISIKNIKILREKHHIDLLIILEINNEGYIIAIENKLDSPIHGKQLEDYYKAIKDKYKSYKKVHVFLNPNSKLNEEDEKKLKNNNYILITYQEVYDNILKTILEITDNQEIKLMLNYYIHTLACYNSDAFKGLIVTDKEKINLIKLFEDEYILEMIDSLYNNKNNEYTQFYRDNKKTFILIFNKFINVKSLDTNEDKSSLLCKLDEIMKKRTYFLNEKPCKSIGELLKKVFDKLLENHKLYELKDLINLYPESVPLIIKESEIDKLIPKSHKNWYKANPKTLENYKDYYVLSAWTLDEYEDLKERFNELKEIKPEIYGEIIID